MGGHGGLNILPQKRWNVYGRENRLKVARDEAKYEAEQAEIRERAEQADRERRRQLLKDRAKQRYADVQALEAGKGLSGHLEYPAQQQQLEWQQPSGADGWQPDAAAIRGLATGQADHFAALEQQLQGQQQQQQQGRKPYPAGEGGEGGAAQRPRKKQRQRWEKNSAAAGPPPSLAQLAAQLDAPSAVQQASQQQGQQPPQQQVQVQQEGGGPSRLERFSLFAEEEAAAAKRENPEVQAEKRDERRRRGNADTQTSDARFDESFAFAHRLAGQAAMPWYAKAGSSLPSDGGPGQQAQQLGSGRRQMWQWEMKARAALAGSALLPDQQRQGQPGPPLEQGQPLGLLAGVKVVQHGSAAASDSSITTTTSSSSSSSGSSSSSSESSGESDSSGSSRERRRRGSKRRHAKRSSKERKRRSGRDKKKKTGSRSKERRHKNYGSGSKNAFEQLRLERLQREESERQRQQRLIAAAAGKDPALAGKKYYAGYGFGR